MLERLSIWFFSLGLLTHGTQHNEVYYYKGDSCGIDLIGPPIVITDLDCQTCSIDLIQIFVGTALEICYQAFILFKLFYSTIRSV